MLEEEGIADGDRSGFSTPGGLMGSVIDEPLQQASFGSQQWDMIPSASSNPDSKAMASCASIMLSPPLPHDVNELANGNHAAHSNGVHQFFREHTQAMCSQACKAHSMSNVTQHLMQETHIREEHQRSDMFVQRLLKQDDKIAEQIEMVETSLSSSNGADYASLLSSTTHQILSSRVDDTHKTSSVKDDLVSPGRTVDLQVFVGDGSLASASQLSRADLRQRISHNQLDDSSQPVSHHTDEVSVESKDFGAPSSSTVADSGIRSEIRDSHGAGPSYQTPEKPSHVPISHTETPHLLDWKQLMSANSQCAQPVVASPFEYFLGEVFRPPSVLLETQSAETDKKRQHVYNTMFHVPWRCELLIVVGFFVCLDSFLSLLTVMPVRIVVLLSGFVSRRSVEGCVRMNFLICSRCLY